MGARIFKNLFMMPPLIFIVLSAFILFSSKPAFAIDNVSNVSISIQHVFAIEFYTDQNVLYSNVVPFTDVDPSKSIVYPDNRRENDGRSDVGVVCKSNLGGAWFLKIQLRPTGNFEPERLKYYVDQPYNRNTGQRADGALARSANWYPFSLNPTTVYIAGAADQSNLPFGTLATFSYSLNPAGLDAGKAYSAAITYTMTTSP